MSPNVRIFRQSTLKFTLPEENRSAAFRKLTDAFKRTTSYETELSLLLLKSYPQNNQKSFDIVATSGGTGSHLSLRPSESRVQLLETERSRTGNFDVVAVTPLLPN